jgi:hypothetical protein
MNQQLDQELHELAAPIELPRGDIGAVMERARHRHRRARAGMAVVTSLSMAAAAVAVTEVVGRDQAHNNANGDSSVISLGAPSAPAKPLVWRRVSVSSALGLAASQATGTGPIYALSTAPGNASTALDNTVYRSVDGINWSEVASPGNDLFLSNLSPTDNRIYAVGTGPASAGTSNDEALYAGWSDDGAKTWSKQALPLDLGAISRSGVTAQVANAAIAAGKHGSVIVAQLNANVNNAALPAGVKAPYGFFQTTNGIDILGRVKGCPAGTTTTPRGLAAGKAAPAAAIARKLETGNVATVGLCFRADGSFFTVPPNEWRTVTRTLSWHDLGISGDLLDAVRGDEFVFLAPHGSTHYERVDIPQLSNVSTVAVTANNDGFELVAAVDVHDVNGVSTGRMVALHSTDAHQWTENNDVPQGVDAVYGVGQFDGSIVVFGSRGFTTPAVFIQNPSGGWTMTSLTTAAGSAVPAGTNISLVDGAVGPFGVVAEVLVSPDIKLGDVRIAKTAAPASAAVHKLATVPSNPNLGTARQTVPPSKAPVIAPQAPAAAKQAGFLLLSSTDGQTWSTTNFASLAGPNAEIERLDQIGDHVVVVTTVKQPGGTQPKTEAFVGTPGS